MTAFFRYIRPLDFDLKRHEAVTREHGGICFHVNPIEGKLVEIGVGVASTHREAVFSRHVAQRIASSSQRFRATVESFTAQHIADVFLNGKVEVVGTIVNEVYGRAILPSIQQSIYELLVNNAKVRQAAGDYQSAVEALNLKERYNDIQRQNRTAS